MSDLEMISRSIFCFTQKCWREGEDDGFCRSLRVYILGTLRTVEAENSSLRDFGLGSSRGCWLSELGRCRVGGFASEDCEQKDPNVGLAEFKIGAWSLSKVCGERLNLSSASSLP